VRRDRAAEILAAARVAIAEMGRIGLGQAAANGSCELAKEDRVRVGSAERKGVLLWASDQRADPTASAGPRGTRAAT
jgi:hypothetical protein